MCGLPIVNNMSDRLSGGETQPVFEAVLPQYYTTYSTSFVAAAILHLYHPMLSDVHAKD